MVILGQLLSESHRKSENPRNHFICILLISLYRYLLNISLEPKHTMSHITEEEICLLSSMTRPFSPFY